MPFRYQQRHGRPRFVTGYRPRGGKGARLAIVHVPSHARQRQNVITVMTLASVSKAVL
jgi:hypothetical protein